MKKSRAAKPKPEKISDKTFNKDFLVVGIGASAGGIQALKTFFGNVAADSGAAYVVILHLSPEHESKLAEVLQTNSQIAVTQVTERVKVEPNHVFVVMPNQSLAMADGHIVVSPIKTIEERRAPVDIFFRTLAETHHEQAVCVVLSGTGADGSMGLKRVKENGGAVFVQNPREAEFSDMARNAIATDLVDEVLNVAEIPAKIVAYRDNLKTVALPVEPEARPEDEQKALREIFTQLRVRTGHDFTNYKRPTMFRRIERRISVRNLLDIVEYASYLKAQPEEVQALLKDLLISVTNFFRDKQAFTFLEHDVIPRIVHEKRADDQIRVWVAGCATGEEAYSLAMLFAERLDESGTDQPEIQIFASDIDEDAIATAREGFYTLNDAADVSPERLRRFFTKEQDGYRVRRELRETVLFANHNVLKDPPFSRLDLITCRNMLIYLNPAAQKRVMETFHFALRPDCFLFLGGSESIDGSIDVFAPVSKENNIFQSRNVESRIPRPIRDLSLPEAYAARLDLQNAASGQMITPAQQDLFKLIQSQERLSYADLHQRLLERFAPPSVVVNEEYDILHLSERAGRFMQIQGGEPSSNLLKVIRPELRLELRNALYQAVQSRRNVEAKNLTLKIEDRSETIDIHVRPVLRIEDTARGFILVLFEKTDDVPIDNHETSIAIAAVGARQLEEELIRVKAQLRTSNEQHEIQSEELRASNEELQALNEEMRASSEELETGKEELQSVNEELQTVNQELKVKIEEVLLTSNNLRNLVNSTDIGTIFLDRNFRVQLFTPSAREIFNLIPNDYGRPLSDITHRLEGNGLLHDAETVLEKLQTVEREVRTVDNRVFTMRVLPYRTADDRIQGTVITFFDITERKRADEARFYLASIVESSEDSMLTVDLNGRITSWNRAAELLYGYPASEAVGKPLTMLALPGDLAEVLRNAEKIKDSEQVEIYDTVRVNRDGREMNLEVVLSPVKDSSGAVIGVSTIARDVTERRRAQATVKLDLQDTVILQELSTRLVSEENVQTIYDEILTAAIRITRSEAGTVQIYDADSKELVLLAANGFKRKMTVYFERVNADSKTACGGALRDGERTFADFAETDADESLRMHAEAGYHAAQSTPLIARSGKPIGMLNTHWKEAKHRPTMRELRFLDLLARQAADLIEQRQVEKAVHQSEETFSALVENAPFGVYLVDADFRLRTTNEGSRKVFSNIEPLIGRDFGEILRILWHEPFADEAIGRFRHTLETGESFISPPIVQPRANIEEIEAYDWQLHRVTLPDGSYGVVCYFYDLSEQKQMEAAVRESEERLNLAASVSNFGVHDFDLEKNYLYWSPELKAMNGLAPDEEITFETLPELFHPEDRERMNKAMRAALDPRGTGEFEQEFRIVRPDTNETRWLYNRSRTTFSGKGKAKEATRNTGIVIDVTSRKQAEEAVRESETRFRAIVNQATAAIAEFDLEGNYTLVNETLCNLLGYTEAEFLQMNQRDITHPEDLPLCLEAFEQAIATGKASVSEKRVICKDGTIVWVTESISSIADVEGKPQRVAMIAFDISGRKGFESALQTSNERLRLLIESVSDYGIFTMTLDNRIDSWNTGAEKIFGWTENEAIGQTGEIIFTPEDRAKGAPETEISVALAEGRSPDERFHLAKNGSRFYVSGMMNLLRDAEGNAKGFVKIARDMTAKMEAEKALQDKETLQKLVIAQEDERRRIARDLHDELGQQLTALRLKLDVARKMCSDDDICAKIDEIKQIARSIDNGVDFLAWELRPAALDQFGLIAELSNYVEQWSHFSGVSAELLTSSLKKMRFAPEVEINLYRIVQEALNNIHKHAKAKRVEVMLEKRDHLLILIIGDDGRGFNPQNKKKRQKGIGLIGMRERTALIKGTFEIESASGEGTTIFVRVPAESLKKGSSKYE